MRRRDIQIPIRLNAYEFTRLEEKIAKTGWSREAYIRSVLADVCPSETPPIDYHKMINLLRNIANNFNQIAVKAHTLNIIDADAYNQNLKLLHSVLQEIQKAILLPKKVENGNNKNMDD